MDTFRRMLYFMLIISGFLISAHGERRNPLKNPRICGIPECDTEENKFGYGTGKLFRYAYRSHVRSEFFGSGQNASDLYITGNVELKFPKNCEGVLHLSQMELSEVKPTHFDGNPEEDYDSYDYDEPTKEKDYLHPKSKNFAEDLEEYPLRFSFHDGIVEEVCPEADETSWVLNFKKSVLSVFQNSMLRFDVDRETVETDISGKCNVAYTYIGSDAYHSNVFILKTKNIESCQNRYKTESALQTTPYTFSDNKEIWPIVKSSSWCNQSVDNYIFDKINCFERHLLIPFSNNNSGAVTVSNVTLWKTDSETFDPENEGEENVITRRSTLIFDHNPTPTPAHGELQASRDLLKRMCKQGFPNIERNFIEYFTKFLNTVRLLSYEALKQLLKRSVSICSTGKKHVLESLPYIGSTASVKIMIDNIIAEKPVDKRTATSWVESLSFLTRPTKDMIDYIYKLVEYGVENGESEYILGGTAVVHTFCRIHSDCHQNEDVKLIVEFLEQNFNFELSRTMPKRVDKEKLVTILKGLGNVGGMNEHFIAQIQELIVDERVPVEIRVQAIMAFRRMSCESNKNFFLDVYQNFTANSEVRTFSYLQAIRCPDYKTMKLIKSVLENEEVNQVGSYVWSHLTNLGKSASPFNVEVQGLLIDSDLGSKYNLDIRKFSRNFEHSLFFDEYNFGVGTDANLIFGTNSYLPRIMSVNFTADLFGESVNFFEVSMRTEGFEQLIGSIFGPKGPLNAKAFRKKFSFMDKFFDDDEEMEATSLPEELKALDHIRFRRDAETNNDAMYGNVTKVQEKRRRDNYQSRNMERSIEKFKYNLKYDYNNPRAVFDLKIFGNDLKYYSFEGASEIGQAVKSLNIFNQIGSLLSGKELTYTKSGIVLDASYNVPMISGFPLSIHAFAASSADIRVQGKIDTFRKPLEYALFDVDASMKPSVSVDVLTTMKTNAFYAVSGVRVKSNFYSSSALQSKIKVRRERLVSVEFTLPQEQNEIFSARSELLVLKDTQEIPQKGIDRRYANSTCSWRVLSEALGLKVCADYSLPDISNSTAEHPALVLCGPIDISVQLKKADASVKTFLFEYKSNQTNELFQSLFTFQTPGSVVPRILTANLTKNPEELKISTVLTIADRVHSAVANYHNKPNDYGLEIYFDTNGNKSLHLEATMESEELANTIVYAPRIILSVNNEKIAGLAGTVNNFSKPGLNQYQINLTFETKKLQANTIGYLTKSEAAYTAKMDTFYRFQDNSVQNITVEAQIADRSERTKAKYEGYLNIKSTAYKIMNFVSNIELTSLLGHMEGKFRFNNVPNFTNPRADVTVRGVFKRASVDDLLSDGLRTTLSFEVTKPEAFIDFKASFQHEERHKNGLSHTVDTRLRYASDREASGIFSVHFPRRQLFAVDALANITIPSFNSCLAHIQVMEKKPRDYMIDLSGIWFTNHSIKVRGTYQDNSSKQKSYHRMKFLVTSPHFQDTAMKLEYRRSFSQIYFNLHAEHNKLVYGGKFNYTTVQDYKKTMYVEVRYRDQIYSISSKILTLHGKELGLELHLDKIRDIAINVQGLLDDDTKEGRIEVMWDVNRDPSKKLALTGRLDTSHHKRYDALVMLTYPERTFSCTVKIYTEGPIYRGNSRISWNVNETIILSYNAGILSDHVKNYWVRGNVITPFEGWLSNSLEAGFYGENNLLIANASAFWADNQYISTGIMGNYESNDEEVTLETKFHLNSTIQDIPTLGLQVKHSNTPSSLDSNINLIYKLPNETLQLYALQSKWKLDFNDFFKNVSGSMEMKSPFKGYETGAMKTKLSLSRSKNIRGAATLMFEDNKYTMVLDGHIKKLTDNKLVINITTPIEKFKTIAGRFGINERDKHVVAEVRAPAGALGIEVILELNSFSDFNVKLSFATPLEAFKNLYIIGKMKTEIIDMRGGWNDANLGFTGVWRMENLTDFEYSYRILTPIEHFEDNGAVAKLIYGKNIDFELFAKISTYKLGTKLYVEHKPKLIAQLSVADVQLEDSLGIVRKQDEDEDEYDVEDEDDLYYDSLWNYIVYVELDTLIYPTIKGTADLEEIKDDYILTAKLELPQGSIIIKNKLYFPDYFLINNYLKIYTPFPSVPEIKSRFGFQCQPSKYYIAVFDVSALYMNKWVDMGYNGSYVNKTQAASSDHNGEDENMPDNRVHTVQLTLKSPFEVMRRIDFYVSVDVDERVYRGNFTAKTDQTFLSLGGSCESDQNFLDVSLGFILRTNVVPNYSFKVFIKKDSSDMGNAFNFGFDILDDETNNKFRLESTWYVDEAYYMNARGRMQTNMIPLKKAETVFFIRKHPHILTSLNVDFLDVTDQRMNFHASVSKKDNMVNVEIQTPVENFKNITLNSKLTPLTTANHYELNGNLYRNTIGYNVRGIVEFESELPVQGKLFFEPKSGGAKNGLVFSLKRTPGDYGRTFELNAGDPRQYCKIAGGYSFRNLLDWNFVVRIQTSEPQISNINVESSIVPRETKLIVGNLEITTPWKHLGVDSVKLGCTIDLTKDTTGYLEGNYLLGPVSGRSKCLWTWILLENMQISFNNVMERNSQKLRMLEASMKYENLNKDFRNFNTMGKINVDHIWMSAVHAALSFKSTEDIMIELSTLLPEPIADTHTININYTGDFLTSQYTSLNANASYNSEASGHSATVKAIYDKTENINALGRAEWGVRANKQATEANFNMVKKGPKQKEVFLRVATPMHEEDTLHARLYYNEKAMYHNVQAEINYPSSVVVGKADVDYFTLSNMNGYVNATVPVFNITWLRGDFDFKTTGSNSTRFLKATWPQDFAQLHTETTFKSVNLDRDTNGMINMEVPFKTRHKANINFSVKEREKITLGDVDIIYNNMKVLKGTYKCDTEERAGFRKDVVNIDLENQLKPIGIFYTHRKHYVTSDMPDLDIKHIEVYQLRNASAFNLTGEFHIKTTDIGQSYTIIAIHPNRTVILDSEQSQDGIHYQTNSKLELAPNVWIGYKINTRNFTTSTNESQLFGVDIFYPKRNLSAEGWYSVTTNTFDSNVLFKWTDNKSGSGPNRDDKEMRAGISWYEDPDFRFDGASQTAVITIGHPSFEKDIKIISNYTRNLVDLFNADVIIDYNNRSSHLVTLKAVVRDLTSLVGYRNYSYEIYVSHDESNIKLNASGSAGINKSVYKIESTAEYYKLFDTQYGYLLSLVDLKNKLFHYYKISPEKIVRYMIHPHIYPPVYGLNATYCSGEDTNATGYFYVDVDRKYTRMDFNLTTDGSHNVQMVGIIPDKRSAYFDMWRNYEEIRVIDVTYFLRMNHSRLIASRLKWRPKLKKELKKALKDVVSSVYDEFSDSVDFVVKTIYTETTTAASDIWDTAKGNLKGFLQDFKQLSLLEEDLNDFRTFLNESYEANDFYIKTVVNFTLTSIDELAIRDHIESLPRILTELWQVMGESGQAIAKSVQWLIETLKTSYQNALDMISRFLHGESLEHISNFIQLAVEKYDKFIKDLHVSLTRHVENLWIRFSDVMSNYWRTLLKKIEPLVFKFLHYIESALWSVSSDVLEFIRERTNELAESPYFDQVTGFTQSIDYLYEDLMANDALTNLRKYSSLAWNFVTERLFNIIPFGKEINDIATELWEGIKQLQELESIQTIINKYNELKIKMEWLAEELEVERRIHQLWYIARNKMRSYTETAFETDDRYREAKTKFIFDPDNGLMELEQKLPISWHAFNETPKFDQIPEYKFLSKLPSSFSISNFTLWGYIYNLRMKMDPRMWLPPYKARSLLINSRHFMTFDGKLVSLNFRYDLVNINEKPNLCTYLLSRDFFNKNFTLVLEPSIFKQKDNLISTRKLILMINDMYLEIDIVAGTVRVNRNLTSTLPMYMEEAVIYMESEILTVESENDFVLSCNLQFDICWFDVGGWYFGQTAGLLGTMTNEQFDDYTTSYDQIVSTDDEFINSWTTKQCQENSRPIDSQYSSELRAICDEFFRTQAMANCFPLLNPVPFYDMCLDLGSNSISTVLNNDHPSERGACSAALAYIEACNALKIPLRIPDKCVHCELMNGSYVSEGTFMELEGNDIPRTADVVFIVEAKNCNINLTSSKNLMNVVNALQRELAEANITNNRFAVVGFGGPVPFDKPRSVVFNKQVFTDGNLVKHYFEHISSGYGVSNDVFQAISFASKLIFRPGSSKIFILIPCSKCVPSEMKLDYSSLLQLMLEEGINLHILMEHDFAFDKQRFNRICYGIDRNYAYTKDSLNVLKGDPDARKQFKMPKDGLCVPLAIETNGSIFSARKLKPDRRNPVKKVARVFAKRIVKTAVPPTCQLCECTGHNSGVAYMTCGKCHSSDISGGDYDFDETFQGFDLDWDAEVDEDYYV